MKTPLLHFLLLVSPVLLFLPGCASYHWGSALAPEFRKIAVPVFENASSQPEVEALMTQFTRSHIIADGALTLVPLDDAAITLFGRVTRFDTRVARFSNDIRDMPVEFRVIMEIEVTVEDTQGRTLRPLKTFTATTTVIPAHSVTTPGGVPVAVSDLPTSKNAAAHRLASELASDILLYLNTP